MAQSFISVLHVQKSQMFLLRVRLRWRATWRVWLVSWRLTFQTTKTKSCVYYVLCKLIDLVLPHRCIISLFLIIPGCLFMFSARLLPEKLTVYTTLVGLLNARNYNFGGEFVEAMIRQLKETLKNNLYDEAVYLVCWLLTKQDVFCQFQHLVCFLHSKTLFLFVCCRCVFCPTWSTAMWSLLPQWWPCLRTLLVLLRRKTYLRLVWSLCPLNECKGWNEN